MTAGAGKRRQGGHRDILSEDQRRRAGTSAATVENDVVDSNAQSSVDVLLDMLSRDLESDRDAAGCLSYGAGEVSEII